MFTPISTKTFDGRRKRFMMEEGRRKMEDGRWKKEEVCRTDGETGWLNQDDDNLLVFSSSLLRAGIKPAPTAVGLRCEGLNY